MRGRFYLILFFVLSSFALVGCETSEPVYYAERVAYDEEAGAKTVYFYNLSDPS